MQDKDVEQQVNEIQSLGFFSPFPLLFPLLLESDGKEITAFMATGIQNLTGTFS